ncbi:MAG: T9SS type A sorting domain-containing protein, partial [Calditrichales bacterium]|nr:T9SS type A sorting domain-containing protein [Calditrichales bacterium]
NNISHPFPITTDAGGEVWLIIGTDSGFEATTTLYYNKIDVTFEITSGIDEHADFNKNVPNDFCLNQNYPNPFNPQTTISYQLPVKADVALKIYNLLGQEGRTLVNENKNAGKHSVVWDGRDNSGIQVSSGIYLYHINSGKYSEVKKCIVLK